MARRFLRCKRAIETVTAIFVMLIMITAITMVVVFFSVTNSSMQGEMKIEEQRAREKISITGIGLQGSQVTNISIENMGSIDVLIKALYRSENGIIRLLTDPSIPVPQGTAKTIDLTGFGLTMQEDSSFMASTERGTKSMSVNEIELNYRDYTSFTNSSALSIGPLCLTFDSLNWALVDATGNVVGEWSQSWTIPSGYTCAWRLNVTNIDADKRNITISQHSGFTLSKVGSPSTATWYLRDAQQIVDWNTTATIVYVWTSNFVTPQTAISNQRGVNNVFLTFFGSYSDGKSLAQTVPFEAVIVT